MDVSWKWLNDYVTVPAEVAEVAERLTMSGLNHESTTAVGTDYCLDLEVTSNRPDCLGHLGVAREISVLYGVPLRVPEPKLSTVAPPVLKLCEVQVKSPELCRRYTARVVSGVRVGPSPAWMVERLATLGLASINNVVDVSNYVMFECGQPLHTFDLDRLAGQQITVREATAGERIAAINHQEYELPAGTCVIADSQGPVAIAGIMGGSRTEISAATTNVLIEAAWFAPAAVRRAARQLNLHSDSSFRFERHPDVAGVEWASRRCAELLVQVAGGQIAEGIWDVAAAFTQPAPVNFRPNQVARILGIEIPRERIESILVGLGSTVERSNDDMWSVVTPTWRRDLSREIDLIEELGRIYGYEHVPDTISVPLTPSHRPAWQRLSERVRRLMQVAGFDEAMCPSLVPPAWSQVGSPWTSASPLQSHQPMLGVLEKGSQNVGPVNSLRRSLIPSLLEAKRINEYRSNSDIDLFEIAAVYLPQAHQDLPCEPWHLGLVTGRDYRSIQGILETLIQEVQPGWRGEWRPCDLEILDVSHSATLWSAGEMVGVIGRVSPGGRKEFGLRQETVVAELNLSAWLDKHQVVRRQKTISEFPAVQRDFNFILAEQVPWSDLEGTIRRSGGEFLEQITYRETFRDPAKDGPDRKRVLLSLQFRSTTKTLEGEEIELGCQRILQATQAELGAALVG